MRQYILTGLVTFAMVAGGPAFAAVQLFSGQDDGVGPGGPFTNSLAAQAAFLAAAAPVSSVIKTETFESATVGAFSPVVLSDFTITTTAANFGAPYSGINNTTLGTLYGFNVTPGGEKWYGFPDFVATHALLTFDKPLSSIGSWITGIQTLYSSQLTLELVGGGSQTFNLPLNVNGGAQFFGIVSDVAFTKVFFHQSNNPGYADAFGIDDISYGYAVPEPATWAMLIAGFGLVGAASRRRSSRQRRVITA